MFLMEVPVAEVFPLRGACSRGVSHKALLGEALLEVFPDRGATNRSDPLLSVMLLASCF